MFQFNQPLFGFSDSFDNLKPSAFDLPTTTHNSPGSLKSKSLGFEDSPFNCSFDQGSQANHAQAIWDASIKYLQASLNQFVDAAKGLNDENLYSFMNENQIQNDQSLQEVILKNTNLKIQQKHEFISDLQNQSELSELLKELSKLFNESVFHEITYVIYKIWQKKNQNKKNQSSQLNDDEPLIPHFDCFWGYEEEQVPKVSYAPFFESKNMQNVIQDADKCADQIAEQLYFDNRLKLLNLKDCNKQSQQQVTVASLFGSFFKTLTRSVFLSTQGFYNQPSLGQETGICQQFNGDFEFQMNEVCALQEFELSRNKFIRSFSQDFEDDEEDFEFSSVASKKRKLQ